MLDLEEQVARQRVCVAHPPIWEKMVLMGHFTASTVVPLEASQALAHALRVTPGTAERVARSQTLARFLLTHLRTVQMDLSTVLTEGR